jgi:hypothetical protein
MLDIWIQKSLTFAWSVLWLWRASWVEFGSCCSVFSCTSTWETPEVLPKFVVQDRLWYSIVDGPVALPSILHTISRLQTDFNFESCGWQRLLNFEFFHHLSVDNLSLSASHKHFRKLWQLIFLLWELFNTSSAVLETWLYTYELIGGGFARLRAWDDSDLAKIIWFWNCGWGLTIWIHTIFSQARCVCQSIIRIRRRIDMLSLSIINTRHYNIVNTMKVWTYFARLGHGIVAHT